MHPVMEGKTQALQLLVKDQAQVICDHVPNCLAAIVVGQGESATQDGGPQQQQGSLEQSLTGNRFGDGVVVQHA